MSDFSSLNIEEQFLPKEEDYKEEKESYTILKFPEKNAFRHIYLYFLTLLCFGISFSIPFIFLQKFDNSDYDWRITVSETTEHWLLIVRILYFTSIIHIILVLSAVIPLLLYRAPSRVVMSKNTRISFCFVSRGTNKQALFRSVSYMYSIFRLYLPDELYEIRAIVDEDVDFGTIPVRKFIVPKTYKAIYKRIGDEVSAEETKYKARALQYMNDLTDPSENEWLVHLDEETTFNWKTLNEICYFIETNDCYTIGQGIITYDSNKYHGLQHILTTRADSMRTSIDCSIFRLQFMLGIPMFGIKGSFIVVNGKSEKEIGFNYGDDVNITEDAFFAIKCWDEGYKFKFIGAMMKEQSPHTFFEFIKQRRRWIVGLGFVSSSDLLMEKHTFILRVMIRLWKLSMLCWNPLILSYIIRFETSPFLNIIYSGIFSVYIFEYLWGMVISEKDFPVIKTILQVIFIFPIPLYPFLECMAILYSVIKPEKGFHIVNKI